MALYPLKQQHRRNSEEHNVVFFPFTYCIQPAELIAGHGDDDSDELPAHSGVLQQLCYSDGAEVNLSPRLGLDLFQLLQYILLPQEPLKG